MSKKQSNKSIIAVEDAAHNLGILQVDIEEWIESDRPKIYKDYRGRDSLSSKYVNDCTIKPDYKDKLNKCLTSEYNRRVSDNANKQNDLFKTKRTELLKDYKKYIKDIESVHTKYLSKVNVFDSETSVTAAYILFARAIALLNIIRDCIERDYWFAGNMLRDIDETLDVALYFIVSEKTSSGKKNLEKWFRSNIAPKHMDCRDVISQWQTKINPEHDKENNESLMNELYHKKSKWIHPTLNSIRDIVIYEVDDQKVKVTGFDYGVCTYERRLHELTHFFRHSIWTTFQLFMLCFRHSMPLEKEDIELLLGYDKLFQKLDAVHADDW